MSDGDRGSPFRGTTTTLRVERPDGTATEVVHRDIGHITVTRFAAGRAEVARYVITIDVGGVVTVGEAGPDGTVAALAASSTQTGTNPYGTTIEELVYDGIGSVASTFDDEGRFRAVSVRGDWGRHDLELRPDESRTTTWTNPLHHGVASWTSFGRLDRYEASFSDGTGYRWAPVGDGGRETVTGWDGRTTVTDDVDPPIDAAMGAES